MRCSLIHTITDDLVGALGGLRFAPPVTYNPLVYARALWGASRPRFV